MEVLLNGLAVFGIVMICAIAIGLQHLAHWIFTHAGDLAIIGIILFLASGALLWYAFDLAITIWYLNLMFLVNICCPKKIHNVY